MGTAAPTPENVAELLQTLQVDPQSGLRESYEVQQNATTGTQDASVDSSGAGSADGANIATAYGSMDGGMYYAFNGYPPQHGYYIGGYDYPLAEWDDYSRHGKTENADGQNRGAYNDGGPLVYHPSGYAYNPQHLIMPYTSGAPVRGEGQLYGAQGFSYAGHVYQQSVPNNVPFVPTSASPRMESGVSNSTDGSAERSAAGSAGSAANTNSANSGSRMGFVGYQSGFYGRGILPVNVPTSAPPDVRVGAPRTDLPKVADVVPQQHGLPALNSNAQNIRPLAPLMPPIPSGQQHRPRIGVTSTAGAVGRAFQPPGRMYPGSANSARITATNVWDPRGTYRQWYGFDKGKGRGNGVLGNGGPSWDVLNEQNKGPRTTRSRYQRTNPGAVRYVRTQGSANGMPDTLSLAMNKDQYNRPDFVTKYDNAKFFIIKSYSEDDIHKSIKYNVWASTANGNKKLDAAYQEVQSCPVPCPVFLLFSVNASGQFCGVAEMTGPVDFNKSMDFWQQDKWMGKVPVKWHIVKDVPNSQFRHIVLENNDNKPVTNSRDTQEVPLRQGLEMLTIFKNFSMKTSILDDFQFYETRQKFMQEKRARQQAHPQHQQVLHKVDENHCQNDSSKPISHDLSGQLVRSDKESKVLKASNGQEIPDTYKQLTVIKGSQIDGAAENQDLLQERPVDSAKNTPKSIEK